MILYYKPKPKHGDKRKIRKFALWPIRINATVGVFLQFYWVEQEYGEHYSRLTNSRLTRWKSKSRALEKDCAKYWRIGDW